MVLREREGAACTGSPGVDERSLDDVEGGPLSIYIGAAGVSSTTGFLLAAGEGVTLNIVGAVVGIAASGTPRVASIDEYD